MINNDYIEIDCKNCLENRASAGSGTYDGARIPQDRTDLAPPALRPSTSMNPAPNAELDAPSVDDLCMLDRRAFPLEPRVAQIIGNEHSRLRVCLQCDRTAEPTAHACSHFRD